MHSSSESASVQVSESTLDMKELLAPYGTEPAFKNRLQNAAVLIVPTDLRPQYYGPVFPDTTREVFQHLRAGLDGIASVDALVRDEEFVDFQFNSEEMNLPVLLVQSALVSLVINILASYIYDRLRIVPGEKSDGRVKSELHIKDGLGAQTLLRYDGPADTFETVVAQCFLNLDLDSENHAPSSNNE